MKSSEIKIESKQLTIRKITLRDLDQPEINAVVGGGFLTQKDCNTNFTCFPTFCINCPG